MIQQIHAEQKQFKKTNAKTKYILLALINTICLKLVHLYTHFKLSLVKYKSYFQYTMN